MLHHGSVGVISEQNERDLTLTLTLNFLLLLPSIVFYDKICVFIIIFTAHLLYEEVMSVRLYDKQPFSSCERYVFRKTKI